MLEGFKMNCFPLNRAIRISVALPKDYNNTSRYYPVVYFLDGQNLYKDEDSYRGTSFQLEAIINQLSLEGKEAIYIGIAAANDPNRRMQEYEEKTLANFILSSLHPYLNSRYRINKFIYAVGAGQASYTSLLLNENDLFKGILLFSPEIEKEKIKEISLPQDHLCYIYAGTKELDGFCYHNALALKEQNPNAELILDENEIHTEQAWRSKLYDALNYIVL